MDPLLFSKLIPGGNPTIILHEPELAGGELAAAAEQCMSAMHIQAEQVGALYASSSNIPHLEMMGGEFCVNATRAASLLLVGLGLLVPLRHSGPECSLIDGMDENMAWAGEMTVSGMPRPVRVLACSDESLLARLISQAFCLRREQGNAASERTKEDAGAEGVCRPPGTVRQPDPSSGPDCRTGLRQSASFRGGMQFQPFLHCAARVEAEGITVEHPLAIPGVALVRMPGMLHLLLDASLHPFPGNDGDWRLASASWRKRCGIEQEPASGVIWHEPEDDGAGRRIWPAVEVRASASEHLETACGSASLALAFYEYLKMCESGSNRSEDKVRSFQIRQPSGQNLLVVIEPGIQSPHSRHPAAAWVAGPVSLAAHGVAYLSNPPTP